MIKIVLSLFVYFRYMLALLLLFVEVCLPKIRTSPKKFQKVERMPFYGLVVSVKALKMNNIFQYFNCCYTIISYNCRLFLFLSLYLTDYQCK